MFDQLYLLVKKKHNLNRMVLQNDRNHIQYSQICQLSSLLSSAAYSLAEKVFDKQTEKQVIAGVEAEERDLGKTFLLLSSTQAFSVLR